MERKFEVSDTTKESEWIQDKRPCFSRNWKCGNCGKLFIITHTTELTNYCGECGFKMSNPQLIKVEYDFD